MEDISILNISDLEFSYKERNSSLFIVDDAKSYENLRPELHSFLKLNSNDERLLISFPGAFPGAMTQTPQSYSLPYRMGGMRLAFDLTNYNHLVFSDPGQFLGGLATSFFLGTKEVNLYIILYNMINKVINSLGFKHENILLFGGSAGGFVAYQVSNLFPEKINTFMLNQQVIISDYVPLIKYKYFSKFFGLLDDKLTINSSEFATRVNCIKASRNSSISSKKYHFLCNYNDPHFLRNLELFNETYKISEITTMETYNGPNCHAAPEYDFLKQKIINIVSSLDNSIVHTTDQIIVRGE